MKKVIALACAGMVAMALTACGTPAATSSTASDAGAASAAAESTPDKTTAPEEASEEVSAAASSDASTAAGAADEASAGTAETNAEGETVTGDLEDVTTNDAAGGTEAGAAENTSQAAAAGEVSIDSSTASELNRLLADGDFTGALDALEESGAADSPDNTGVENLTTALQALSDAASACNITREPNSGNVIVYGDDATVVDGTTNAIPFVNLTHGFTHLQLGFVDRFDDPNGYHDATPTSVDLNAGGQTWTWNVDASNSVTVPQDGARTWVLETALDSSDSALLTEVGDTRLSSLGTDGATVQFVDPAAGNLDYKLSDAETAAFGHIGLFADAFQQVRSMIGG